MSPRRDRHLRTTLQPLLEDEGALHQTPLSWQLREEDETTTVVFSGGIDENVDLGALAAELAGRVIFDLRGITYINSCGVREWVNLMRSLDRVRSLAFTRCSPAIVAQLNLVFNFRGNAEVRSVDVPYYCQSCHREESLLLPLDDTPPKQLLANLPRLDCQHCGAEMECDELPERYFAFLLVS